MVNFRAALRVETMASSNMLKQMWAAVKELEIEIGTLENELANKQTEVCDILSLLLTSYCTSNRL